ncbi:hypothetical protein [Methanomethylovorans sp.]|uniref:DUF7288 family protein n=1 Tax=Methanomethylovorans sp. TaxID=2758717 RepID=UPI00351C19B6
MDDKAQLHTLEGVGAAVLITMTLVIITQSATVMTPQHEMMLDVQLEQMAYDALTLLDTAPSSVISTNLTECVAGWDMNESNIQNKGLRSLGKQLSLLLPGFLYNVDLAYVQNDTLITKNAIVNGDPTEDAVVASKTVMLTNLSVAAAHGAWTIASDEIKIVEVRLTLWQV